MTRSPRCWPRRTVLGKTSWKARRTFRPLASVQPTTVPRDTERDLLPCERPGERRETCENPREIPEEFHTPPRRCFVGNESIIKFHLYCTDPRRAATLHVAHVTIVVPRAPCPVKRNPTTDHRPRRHSVVQHTRKTLVENKPIILEIAQAKPVSYHATKSSV